MLLTLTPTIDRSQAIEGLSRLRQEWESAVTEHGQSLEETGVNYLLQDVAAAIGLTDLETAIVMGHIQIGMRAAP